MVFYFERRSLLFRAGFENDRQVHFESGIAVPATGGTCFRRVFLDPVEPEKRRLRQLYGPTTRICCSKSGAAENVSA